MRYQLFSFVAVLALVCVCASAETIYQVPDGSGGVIFTDKKRPGAKPVKLQKIKIVGSPSDENNSAQSDNAKKNQLGLKKKQPIGYKQLSLTAPTNGQTFWNKSGSIPLQFSLSPELAKGDRVVVYVDGAAISNDKADAAPQLPWLPRGEHTVRVSVVNSEGVELISSESHTIYVHQTSIKH